MATLKSYGELLSETQQAISALMAGAQEYEINGDRFRRADLNSLRIREDNLMKKVEAFGPNATPGSATTMRKAKFIGFVR